MVASASQIHRHIEKDYYLLEHPMEDEIAEQLEHAKRNAHEVDTEKLYRLILMSAINSRATDIHITPTDMTSQVHYRIDGFSIPSTPSRWRSTRASSPPSRSRRTWTSPSRESPRTAASPSTSSMKTMI